MNLIKSSISFYKQQRNSWLHKLIGQLTVGTELHGFVSGGAHVVKFSNPANILQRGQI